MLCAAPFPARATATCSFATRSRRRSKAEDPKWKGKSFPCRGRSSGSIELSDAVFGLPMNEDVIYYAINNELANKRVGTAVHEGPRRGPRLQPQALCPEGHRPRPPGRLQVAGLRRRRHGLRPQAPGLLLRPAQEGEATRDEDHPEPQGPGRHAWPIVEDFTVESGKTKDFVKTDRGPRSGEGRDPHGRHPQGRRRRRKARRA